MSARRLAVVPARGGSKRIPNKNTRDFCGKPMIAHILAATRSSGLFDTIHVSTESDEIARVVEGLGVRVPFLRPAELADDFTPLMPVLKNVAEEFAGSLNKTFDQIWLLMACAPLILPDDLVAASRRFEESGRQRPLMTVVPFAVPIEWAFDLRDDCGLVPVQPGKFAIRSQDLPVRYHDAGAFYIYPSEHVLSSRGAGDDSAFVGFELSAGKAVDIDSEDDWRFAEQLFRGRMEAP